MNRPGLRFTVTRHNRLEDITAFVSALAASAEEAGRAITETLDAGMILAPSFTS